jgi:hypothetical protein
MLVGKHYLASILGPKKKVRAYSRGPEWPPPKKFLHSAPIGFTYYIQRWFKMYLAEHIKSVMDTLEAHEELLQLDHRAAGIVDRNGGDNPGRYDFAIPHAEGEWVDHEGTRWAADISLMKHQLDLSEMTDEWVKSTKDKLFRNLKPSERKLLQLVYLHEMPWQDAGAVLNISGEWAKKKFLEILQYLRSRAGTANDAPPIEEAA